MAKIIFEKGDLICFQGGFGIITGKDKALLIKGVGGRTGRVIEKGDIPEDALPNNKTMDFEVSFALKAVAAVIS
jgi:hypothetical protein